jgi:hypothetical protein
MIRNKKIIKGRIREYLYTFPSYSDKALLNHNIIMYTSNYFTIDRLMFNQIGYIEELKHHLENLIAMSRASKRRWK